MTDVRKKFLKRLVLYNMQYVPATIMPLVIWYILGHISSTDNFNDELAVFGFLGWIPSWYSIFNTVTYLYGKLLVKKYGYEVFSDVDPQLLKEHFNVDSKSFGKHYKALMKYRRFAGPYMTAAITLSFFIHGYLAVAVAIACFIGCLFFEDRCGTHGTVSSVTSSDRILYNDFNMASPDFNWPLVRVRGTREAAITGHTFCRLRDNNVTSGGGVKHDCFNNSFSRF
jgi:hypothetical protein